MKKWRLRGHTTKKERDHAMSYILTINFDLFSIPVSQVMGKEPIDSAGDPPCISCSPNQNQCTKCSGVQIWSKAGVRRWAEGYESGNLGRQRDPFVVIAVSEL